MANTSPPKSYEDFSVELNAIQKSFPGVRANSNGNLKILKGTIHALLGENGAGKSTLMNVLAGVYRPDSGEIKVHGTAQIFRNPADALNAGIGMVHQEFRLIPSFSVAENVILSSSPPVLKAKEINKQVASLADRYGLNVDPAQPLWQLSMGERQKVEILKVLWRNGQVLILDEPTTVLTPAEVNELGQILRRMANDGRSIIFISHKLHEVSGICDEATVLRQGSTVAASLDMKITNQEDLARHMVGSSPMVTQRPHKGNAGEPLLEITNLTALGARGTTALNALNFVACAGEIVGIAGVAGNGQRELADVIAGLRQAESGSVVLNSVNATNLSPQKRFELGLAYIPEDRLGVGLAPRLSLIDNAILRVYQQQRRGPFIAAKRAQTYSENIINQFEVRAGDPSGAIASLSGGNLQRLLVGRELDTKPTVVLASQPTRGLDVKGVKAIQDLLIRQRDAGSAVVMVSEDLDELLTISDRLLVMEGGHVRGEFDPRTASREEVGLSMVSNSELTPRP